MPLSTPCRPFLSLPYDIRLIIYKFALIKRTGPPFPETQIHLHHRKDPESGTLCPSLLLTCRTIHAEANEILYSANVFTVVYPRIVLKWLERIGPENVKLVKKARVLVEVQTGPREIWYQGWYELFRVLACSASGLRDLEVYWAAVGVGKRWMSHLAGADVEFVRELGEIKGLSRMRISGYFAMHWPQYLERKMGLEVWRADECSEETLEELRKYQRGTEEVWP